MASSVAAPLERHLGAIAGVTELTSVSSLGSATLAIQFDLSRKVDTCAPGRVWVFGPASQLEPLVTMSRQGESRAILRIAFYRLPK